MDGSNNTGLARQRSRGQNGDHVVDIPLTSIETHRTKEGDYSNNSTDLMRPTLHREGTDNTLTDSFNKNGGRRRLKGDLAKGSKRSGVDGEEDALTRVGQFYEAILNFSFVTRYLIYILPLATIIAIPLVIGATVAKNSNFDGVPMRWVFAWVEIVWCSLWVSKIVAKCLPYVFKTLIGVVSSGTRKYYKVIQSLEIPLTLVGWAFASWASFNPMLTQQRNQRPPNLQQDPKWQQRLYKVLLATLVATLVFLGKCVLVQLISIQYHQKQFALRIRHNKESIRMLARLYDCSRTLFPSYCAEFADEDYILHATLASGINTPGHKRSGSATPMRILNQVGRVGDNITSAFGNVAKEITGKNVFNPNSAYSIVIDAMQRRASAEALARRIWMSFVEEGKDSLYQEDLVEVLGPDHKDDAMFAFMVLDRDGNGDVSLEEMISTVVELSRERKTISKSMGDIDSAISALDSLLSFIVFLAVIFIYVAFLNETFQSTVVTAGTALLSLSFVFAATAQEILGSCIFIFVKHPFDVGDRVDLSSVEYVVEHISLLYTVFRNVANNKTTQIPNNVLNGNTVENISRSKSMQEIVQLEVHFDTTMDDILLLRNELQTFVLKESRDFRSDNVNVEISNLALNKLQLKIEIRHKGNWADEAKRLERRNKFMTALVAALRKVPIYGPGAGDPGLGEGGNPSFSVAISAGEARERMEAAKIAKAAKKMKFPESLKTPEQRAADAELAHAAALDKQQQQQQQQQHPWQAPPTFTTTAPTPGGTPLVDPNIDYSLGNANGGNTSFDPRDDALDDNERRRSDVQEVRDLLRRQSTTGRRRRAEGGANSPYSSVGSQYAPQVSGAGLYAAGVSPSTASPSHPPGYFPSQPQQQQQGQPDIYSQPPRQPPSGPPPQPPRQ